MEKNLIRLEDIEFKFPNSKNFLFKNLNLKIPLSKKIVGILGPNGVGKTVLAQIMVGFQKIRNGSISFKETKIQDIKASSRIQLISLTPQFANSVFIKQTVEEEIKFSIKSKQKFSKVKFNSKDLLKKNLERLSFVKNSNPFFISGGEKKKLIFANLSILDPKIFILDEPTNGLDNLELERLLENLEHLVQKDKKLLIISHDIKFLSMITDYIIILNKDNQSGISSIIFQGSFEKLLLSKILNSLEFLSLPIELKIFREMVITQKENEMISLKEFWSKITEIEYKGFERLK